MVVKFRLVFVIGRDELLVFRFTHEITTTSTFSGAHAATALNPIVKCRAIGIAVQVGWQEQAGEIYRITNLNFIDIGGNSRFYFLTHAGCVALQRLNFYAGKILTLVGR